MRSGDAATVVSLEVTVAREDVLRALGYPPGRQPPPPTMDRLLGMWPDAEARLAPRGAYRIVARDEARAAGMPLPEERVAVGACTIGPAVEEESARAGAAGRLLDALLLDAFGSAAAEGAADALNALVCTAARRRRLFATARVSPGYAGWETARQRDLLALLPVGGLGIALTTGQMMVPRKSVSFAANLVADRPDETDPPCARCGLLRCRHRMTAAGSPGRQ